MDRERERALMSYDSLSLRTELNIQFPAPHNGHQAGGTANAGKAPRARRRRASAYASAARGHSVPATAGQPARAAPSPRALVPSALLLPRRVRIVEVGPRDGLQTESTHVPAAAKVALVRDLARAGLHSIEATAFVSHRRIPRLADAAQVMRGALVAAPSASLSALVPNM
eukprot:IDg9658t1